MSECRASLERKLLYLHEAYLGSRLQNNGRKRAHGTFPFQRACVPLSRVSWPRAALRSTVRGGWPGNTSTIINDTMLTIWWNLKLF